MSVLWVFFLNAFVYKYIQWTVVDQNLLMLSAAYKQKSMTNVEGGYSSLMNVDMSNITSITKSYEPQVNKRFIILTKLIPIEKEWYSNFFHYSRDKWFSLII